MVEDTLPSEYEEQQEIWSEEIRAKQIAQDEALTEFFDALNDGGEIVSVGKINTDANEMLEELLTANGLIEIQVLTPDSFKSSSGVQVMNGKLASWDFSSKWLREKCHSHKQKFR